MRLFTYFTCDTEMLFAGDAVIDYFIDKPQKLKGGEKPPKAVRIRAVIDGPVTATAPYLMVTGPGIAKKVKM